MTLKEAYKILGVSKENTDREIKAKYKKLLIMYHPDSDPTRERAPEDDETEANPVTLALLYKAAQEADEAGDTQQALDCYRMVYDLTADEEVGKIISKIES